MTRNDHSLNADPETATRAKICSGRAARWMTTAASLLVILSLIAVAGPAFSQANKFQFGKRNLKKMSKVIELIQITGTEEEIAEARVAATEMLERINLKRAKPYGRARINETLGSLAIQNGDHEIALGYLEKAISEEALQPEGHLKILFMVGQLQTMLERYDDAIVTLEDWISRVETPSPSSYYTLAVTYYQAERTEDAVAPAKKAVELANEPREPWYRLLLSLYVSGEKYEEALVLLDDIILAFPKKVYWSQMAALYSQIDVMSKSLAVQQLSKSEGFLSEDRDLTRLAQMLMVEGLPHRGAEVMKEGLENGSIEPNKRAYQTYSDTLLQSREWELAVEPLAMAAELNENGSLYVRLAQVNLQLGRWGDAQSSLSQAFDKGDLGDEGQAHILMGIAAFNERKWLTAERAFTRARGFEGTSDVATKWKAYLNREKTRLGVE